MANFTLQPSTSTILTHFVLANLTSMDGLISLFPCLPLTQINVTSEIHVFFFSTLIYLAFLIVQSSNLSQLSAVFDPNVAICIAHTIL